MELGMNIVKTVCGSDEDIGAEEASYISQALSLATGNTLATSMMGNGVLSNTDIAYMQGELLSGNWVVGIIYQSFSDYSHAIVFKNMIENPNVYAIWDPWNNSNHEITLDEDNCFYYNNSFYRVTFVFVCH